MTISRRHFTAGIAASFAFAGLSKALAFSADASAISATGYGPLISDPAKLLDLPKGFSYKIISQTGQVMSDGLNCASAFDGMGCIDLGDDKVALVRNHEITPKYVDHGPYLGKKDDGDKAYDRTVDGDLALPGGTSTVIYDMKSGEMVDQFQSLVGTIRNCAGGVTPWGSWLTCEENVTTAGNGVHKDHGWVFEVPATHKGLIDPKPIKAMGRFNHEAAAVDPETGIVYMTEDANDSLLYRYIPKVKGDLHKGGQLQAMTFASDSVSVDTRNWDEVTFENGSWRDCRWVDITDVESPKNDLRIQGASKGAAVFARGEGIHFGVDKTTGKGQFFFCCTSGGAKKLGQVMRFVPSESGGKLQNFVESVSKSHLDFGDNIAVAPNGHLVVCEDQYSRVVNNHLKGITPEGKTYDIGSTPVQTEFAGACFSPDGSTLFVNLYHPGKTLAITGPWDTVKNS